ncbi:Vms1/Ankzf1 family peptidyl-tRNA hydrolase [Verrucosispora sp. WMMA2044]|uniref:Peptide chain release factor 1 n=1 Tax=Verrucosispora sioxanthis TaxID=2499994 RepID=A0A6M1L3E1_9ACTN|nr:MULTISPECIES: Vms1/Ankzf1 family peptidyl-tRNA hydrolase [Micromonospora]NEE64251.1 peptide chain release factor 1 [Verrucosispora sioxanthis]NGM13361.1 peptide chain release factor 1 [Verrucosispora sioxanthis]WBB51325.1 Vms1/Ankzf1 family peptidyl-tRNA hydrolase [Verrucosispora sp. WMMA2044]
MQLSFLRPLYQRPGPWCSVYLDASLDTEDAHAALDLRWRGLQRQLAEQGADEPTIAAIDRVIRGHDPMPGDYGLAVFGTQGQVVLSEYLSAPPRRDLAAYAPLPHVMPLLAQRGEQVAWVRVLADRTGADAMSVSAGGVPRRAHVTGRESYQLRRVKPGGWSQSRYQRAAMEAWHHNAGDVTAATVELAERVGAEVVVVAGDVRATGMIAAQMPDRWQDLVVRTDAGSRAGGADQTLLDDLTVQTIAEVADQRVHAALDRFGTQEDVGAGLDAVVAALQRNQVDTMLIVDDPSADGQLWIGPAATDIATEPGQLTAVAEPERVRADAALVRALVGTDAELTVLGPDEAPELVDGVGAVLRYVDPVTPGRGGA